MEESTGVHELVRQLGGARGHDPQGLLIRQAIHAPPSDSYSKQAVKPRRID